MPIQVTGYIPSKSAKPLKLLIDVLKPQKPEALPTQPLLTSPPPPLSRQLESTSQSLPTRQKTTAHPANLDNGK